MTLHFVLNTSSIHQDMVTIYPAFTSQVSVPALNAMPFQPNKLCRTVEEAKTYAAEFVLQQLNVPTDGSGTNYHCKPLTTNKGFSANFIMLQEGS